MLLVVCGAYVLRDLLFAACRLLFIECSLLFVVCSLTNVVWWLLFVGHYVLIVELWCVLCVVRSFCMQ